MKKSLIALLMLTSLILFIDAQAGELGRLFYTAQQRQQLESHTTSESAGSVPIRDAIVVNGVVQKTGGKRTVWINGTPQTSATGNDKAPQNVPVNVPGKSQPVQVKVGQRLLLDQPAQEDDK